MERSRLVLAGLLAFGVRPTAVVVEDAGQVGLGEPAMHRGMPERQIQPEREFRRAPSQPAAPYRADARPVAPRMEAPARPMQAPRMERREAPRRGIERQQEE